ncbi:MAG: archaeosortase/exosortase family protein [Kiritimatiellia bacterium]
MNLILFAALIYGGLMGANNEAQPLEELFSTFLLGVTVWILSIAQMDCTRPRRTADKIVAILLLAAGAVIFLRGQGLFNNLLTLFLLATAQAAFLEGFFQRNVLKTWLLLAFALLVLPFTEILSLPIRYPLQLFSTDIAVALLQLSGVTVTSHLTTIAVGVEHIVVTDACNGLVQFSALLFLTVFMLIASRKAVPWKIFQFLCLFPVLVIMNALRLIIVVKTFQEYGSEVLCEPWHSLSCYTMVLLSVALLWLIGKVFPEKKQ